MPVFAGSAASLASVQTGGPGGGVQERGQGGVSSRGSSAAAIPAAQAADWRAGSQESSAPRQVVPGSGEERAGGPCGLVKEVWTLAL